MSNLDAGRLNSNIRTAALSMALMAMVACSYTPINTPTPVEQRPSDYGQNNDQGEQASNEADQSAAPSEERTRVAVVTPNSIDNDSSYDRRQDERSATEELREQARRASKKGELDRAERLLNRALRIAPREPLSYYELAELKLKQHLPDSALQMARKGLSLQPVGRLARKLKDAEQRARDSIL